MKQRTQSEKTSNMKLTSQSVTDTRSRQKTRERILELFAEQNPPYLFEFKLSWDSF